MGGRFMVGGSKKRLPAGEEAGLKHSQTFLPSSQLLAPDVPYNKVAGGRRNTPGFEQ